jgi:hypothetical protein
MGFIQSFFLSYSVDIFALPPTAELLLRLKQFPEKYKIQIYEAVSKAYAEDQQDSAVQYANEVMRLAEKQNDKRGQAPLLLQLGQINALHRNTILALGFYNEELSLSRDLQDAQGVTGAYDAIALLDSRRGLSFTKPC